MDQPIKFNITLGGQGQGQGPTKVTISTNRDTQAADTDSMIANLTLSEYSGQIEKNSKEYIGRIDGTIAVDQLAGKAVGTYLGSTKLEIEVTQ